MKESFVFTESPEASMFNRSLYFFLAVLHTARCLAMETKNAKAYNDTDYNIQLDTDENTQDFLQAIWFKSPNKNYLKIAAYYKSGYKQSLLLLIPLPGKTEQSPVYQDYDQSFEVSITNNGNNKLSVDIMF